MSDSTTIKVIWIRKLKAKESEVSPALFAIKLKLALLQDMLCKFATKINTCKTVTYLQRLD